MRKPELYALTLAILASRIVPADNAERLPSLCPLKRISRKSCAGCGMSRAFILISHLKLARAQRMNPRSLLVYPLVLAMVVDGWRRILIRRSMATARGYAVIT